MVRFYKLFSINGFTIFIFCMLLMGISISITIPFLSLYATQELGMSTSAFGIFMAVSSLSGVFVNTAIAKSSDGKLDRKWIIIIAMISSSLSYLAFVIFQQYLVLLITVTFFGGIGAVSMPQIFAYAQASASESESDDITFAMSTLRSLFSLGFLIGPLLGTIILSAMDYEGLFISTALIFLVIAFLVYFFLSNSKPLSNTIEIKKITNSKTYSLKDKVIALPFIAFILLFGINNINGINTPLFIVNDLNGSQTDVGLVASICAGLEIPIMIVLGALGKKVSNLTLIISACFIGMSYHLMLTFSEASWNVIVLQIIQAIQVAIVMGNGLSYFADIFPKAPGIASTLYANGQTLGKLFGTLGGGFLAQVLGFRYVNIACIFILMFAVIALWITKKHNSSLTQKDAINNSEWGA
ncbi:sugar efflux transporter [Gottfriedia solisilvae]|uniref:MFS transporter n=1 Tax=Gottfriedia solisilvae TaxID=1516104 RepID=A0A8J3EXB6_9BACI|nr:sugar efflux transporter [Gottfriedia solisilvae]GGI14855.1 MFS transporter [Gottfriedia solisilvae]